MSNISGGAERKAASKPLQSTSGRLLYSMAIIPSGRYVVAVPQLFGDLWDLRLTPVNVLCGDAAPHLTNSCDCTHKS